MEPFALAVGILAVVAGVAIVAAGVTRFARSSASAEAFLRALDGEEEVTDEYQRQLAQPFLSRAVKPLGAGALDRIARLTPSHYLDQVHRKLLLAGMTGSLRSEEFVTAQALSTGFGAVVAVAWVALGSPPARIGILSLVLLPAIGLLAPTAWLNRRVAERQQSIRRELPDVLDLLAISVEAGVGFEGAVQIVCHHFSSPLADELSRTLREMELGLPRREALQNLKRRTEVPELSNFVLAVTQADALGMSMGRVLKTQAAELRNKRRQWAREKAGKLPVKILVPLVLFIFPAILVVILGPAAASISKSL